MRLGDFEVYRDLLLQESGVDINPEKPSCWNRA